MKRSWKPVRTDELFLKAAKSKTAEADLEQRRALLWWAMLPTRLEDSLNIDVTALREQLQENVKKLGIEGTLAQNLKDGGATGLYLRTQSTWQDALFRPMIRWNPWMTWGNTVYLIGLFLLGVLGLAARYGLGWLGLWFSARAAMEIALRLRRAIYQHAYRVATLGFPLGAREKVNTFSAEIDKLRHGIVAWLHVIVPEPVHAVLLLAFALWLHPMLTVILATLTGLTAWAGFLLRAMLRRRAELAQRSTHRQSGMLQESFAILRLVKVFLFEAFNQERIEGQLQSLAASQLRQGRNESLIRPILTVLGMSAFFLVLFLSGFVLLKGYLEVQTILVLLLILLTFVFMIVHWFRARVHLQHAELAAKSIYAFLDRTDTMGQAIEAEFLPGIEDGIEFANVSLRDPGTGKVLLRALQFQIPAGSKTALVGVDENEKHAVVSLLARYLDPTQGEVRIDRKNIRWLTLDSVRTQMAFLLEDHQVFTDTVAGNIGCGEAYSLPRIIEAAKLAHAHQFIQKLPKGYETVVGEFGHALKPGEIYRIALARALLRDPALLVLEEPKTPFDDDTKAMVDDTLQRFLGDRTVLYLAHRLSTIKACDQVILLHQGRIGAVGEYRELLAKNDLYRNFEYLEFSEFANQVASSV